MLTLDSVIDLLAERGGSDYGDEPVTQLDHALQAAALAEGEGAAIVEPDRLRRPQRRHGYCLVQQQSVRGEGEYGMERARRHVVG